MDASIVQSKSQELKILANQYQILDAKKTAITGESDGILTVNEEVLFVDGEKFTDLLNAEIAGITAELVTIKESMQTLATAIDTEID